MSWRPATAKDESDIIKMSAELYQEDPGPRPVPVEHTKRTLAELRENPLRGSAWVLDLGYAQGYAFLISFWSNELGGEISTVDEIFVRKELRGQGHGRAFFKKIFSEKKMVAIDLEVTPTNARARRFYEELGFRQLKNAHLRIRF